MAHPFIVTGLPRSRTAWLSVLLTFGDCYCHHDGMAKLPDVGKALKRDERRYCGNSDSGMPLIIKKQMDLYPETRIVVIERDFAEACNSFAKACGITLASSVSVLSRFNEAIHKMKAKYPHISVGFSELDNLDAQRKIWSYVAPSIRFPADHAMKISTMNITIHDDIMRRAARCSS